MKVSVLINNYNYASFITECLDSILDQSHPIHEVIVVDDGSTDDSVERIKAHPLNAICIEKDNAGQYSAMQVATRAATGDIFCYLDSDDTWAPNYLEKVYAAFQSDLKPDFVYTGQEKFGNEHGPHHLSSEINHPRFIKKSEQLLLVKRMYLGASTSANSIKAHYAKQLFTDTSSERLKDYRICADQILVFGSSLIGCSKLQLPDRLVNSRIHGNNSFQSKGRSESEKARNCIRFKRLIEQASEQFNLKIHPAELHSEFKQLIKSGLSGESILRAILWSLKNPNFSSRQRWYWKKRFKLTYQLSTLKASCLKL